MDYKTWADVLAKKCMRANSEITVAARVEETLRDLMRQRGVEYEPTRERYVVRRGRIDSQFGAVVTEYKKRIVTDADWGEATEQLVNYIEGIAPQPHHRDEHLGIVTDGRMIRFVPFSHGIAEPQTPAEIDSHQLRRWIEALVSLQRRGLTPENLASDFAVMGVPQDGLGRQLAVACYEALGTPTQKTWMLRKEWQRLFAVAVDHRKTTQMHTEAYRRAFGFGQDFEVDHARALFALQTTYAIVVKLVALRVLSEVYFDVAAIRFHELAISDSDGLRREMQRVEDGHLLRDLRIDNLLEGSFFAWYVDPQQWTPELHNAIKSVIVTLSDYEGRGPELATGVVDVFRSLYQRTIPPEIRHDLGEYYTPLWLAQATIGAIPKQPGWTGLDPCCGSGTFLVEMISLVLDELAHEPAEVRLAAVLSRVKGLDLNPLAVLTSRVNYLLAIASHLPETAERIEIPIYLGDAAYIPQLISLDGVKALSYSITTDLGPLHFQLPLSLSHDSHGVGSTMIRLEQAIIAGDERDAEAILTDSLDVTSKTPKVIGAIQSLVRNLLRLEAQNWDRIWIRIIDGYTTTAALGPFDFAVGNPPWVEWKDLPDGYRDTIKDLCRKRGLFSDDAYSGGTDLNIAALIASTVIEQWVKRDGYLCFLMPRSLLQLRSTQGFRRWMLPDGSPLALERLDDWSTLQPFEGATTIPTGYLIRRGAEAPRLINFTGYVAAEGHGAASRPACATWNEIEDSLTTVKLGALQVNKGDPYLIGPPDLMPRVQRILGESAYRGRRATETSPHAVFWLRCLHGVDANTVLVENDQNPRSRIGITRSRAAMETTHLYPVIQGRHIRAFGVELAGHLVLLPHNAQYGQRAIPETDLRHESPLTYQYLARYKEVLQARGSRVEYRVDEPFYALWRVGPYTFAPYKVVWPEIGSLRAAVISEGAVPWGMKMIIPEGKVNLIACDTEDEAHFVCGLLNAPLVRTAYESISSSIGRPVRLPFRIPQYDSTNPLHREMAGISYRAHAGQEVNPGELLDGILAELFEA